MSWLGGWFDPELEELFHDEPELRETAQRIRAARPDQEADPRFRNRLRAQLLAEAARGGSPRGVRRWWHLGPAHVAWGGAVVGAALIGATVLTFVANHTVDRSITFISDIATQHAVSPDHVITVAFNQPMDEQAVESGVHIQPATKVAYSWEHNTLVISPVHHLTGNTPYTVTIAQSAIRAASGASASAPINITFGTAPTPPPSESAPPSLTPIVVGQNGTGGSLFFAPDGSVVSTAGVLPQPVTTSPSPSATATPTPSSTPGPEGVITATPDLTGALVDFPASGTPTRLGPAPSAAAFAPDGAYLATAVDNGNGGSRIVVMLSDGKQKHSLTNSPAPVIALTWSSNDRIVYTSGTSVDAVDLSGATSHVYSLTGGGTITTLDPGGAYAYVPPASGTGGALVDLATGVAQVLQGSVTDVAFSGDGSTVAWADESSNQVRLLTEPVTRDTPAAVTVLDPSATVGNLTLDQDGDETAYLTTDTAGSMRIVAAQMPSGTPLAIGSGRTASTLALSPSGEQIAFISNDSGSPAVELATVPGAAKARSGATIPAAANSALHAFVEAQIRGDAATLAALSGQDVDAAGATPQNLSRAYVITTYLRPDGSVSASVELIVDPTSGHHNARVASEELSLARGSSGDGYQVTRLQTTPLRDESSGPHVVQVSTTVEGGVTTLEVSFDSDLNPATVAGAITVLSQSGTSVVSSATYDANSRTATVTIANPPPGILTLAISSALGDVEGQTLAPSFHTSVATNS